MSRLQSFKGFIQTFFWLMSEELQTMDHKLFRIAAGAASFAVTALFWYLLFRPF